MPRVRPRFPETAAILGEAWQALKDSDREQHWTIRDAADKLDISHAAFNSWLLGRRRPSRRQVPELARFLTKGDRAAAKALESQIHGARATEHVAEVPDALRRIQDSKTLRIGVVVYPPFGANTKGTDVGFFGSLFQLFASYMGCQAKVRAVTLDSAEQDLCEKRSLDIITAIFAIPDRALSMKFFPTPIRVPLNAVVLENQISSDKDLTAVQNLLEGPPGDSTATHKRFHFIVAPNEAGDLFVRHTLGADLEDKLQGTYVEYEAGDFIEALETKRPGRSVVAVVDEMMCRSIIKGSTQPAKLVFEENLALPTYSLCAAVDRADSDWIAYLTDALEFFVRSNVRRLRDLYQTLENDLVGSLSDGNDVQSVKCSVRGWLRDLELHLPSSDPWTPIAAEDNPGTTAAAAAPASRKPRRKKT